MRMDITPEERLLTVIRRKLKKQAVPAPQASADAKAAAPKALKTRFPKNGRIKQDLVNAVNKYLLMLFAMLAVYLISDFLFIKPYKDIRLITAANAHSKQDLREGGTAMPAPDIKDYSYYLNQVSGKELFGQPMGAQDAPGGDAINPDDAADNLALIGVLGGADAKAIIEDKKNNKTYYLKKGDSIAGAVVEEISEKKVTLDRGGKKTTLFL